MKLLSEKDHAHMLKDPALAMVNTDGRPQIVFPYRLGPSQPQLPRRDAQTVLRQSQLSAQRLSAVPLNGTVSNQYQIKTMTPPVLGPQMRISSNGGMRLPAVPATDLQNGGNIPHSLSHPQPTPIPVSQHSPASRAAIAMPYVDAQKPEVIAPAVSNSTMATSQPDANAKSTLNDSPARPKAQNLTPQHGGLTNGFHFTPMTNLTTPMINSAFAQNQPHSGGLSLQQMQNLKTAFANIPAPDLAALQNVGRAISASYMNLAVNGPNLNMQLPAGANMKMSPQMQRAINSATLPKTTSGANGTDGHLNGGSTITASSLLGNSMPSSPTALRSPAANDARTPPRNGVHVRGQRSLTPHTQPASSPLLNSAQALHSPRPSMASTAGIPSSSLQQQQQAVKTQNGF